MRVELFSAACVRCLCMCMQEAAWLSATDDHRGGCRGGHAGSRGRQGQQHSAARAGRAAAAAAGDWGIGVMHRPRWTTCALDVLLTALQADFTSTATVARHVANVSKRVSRGAANRQQRLACTALLCTHVLAHTELVHTSIVSKRAKVMQTWMHLRAALRAFREYTATHAACVNNSLVLSLPIHHLLHAYKRKSACQAQTATLSLGSSIPVMPPLAQ